jgi:dimethylargininase
MSLELTTERYEQQAIPIPVTYSRQRNLTKYSYKAITRGVSLGINNCELTYRQREPIDHRRAAAQLEQYCRLLRKWNVELMVLPSSESQPDCCFVQDTAIVLDEICIVASMGAATRAGETLEVEKLVAPHRLVRRILPPATLEGGDVVQVDKRLFVGVSSRTNANGVASLTRIVEPYGYDVVPVSVTGGLHLTTGCGVVNDDTVILNPRWVDATAFKGLRQLHVPEEEPWAANTIRIEDEVCVERHAPRTIDLVQPFAANVETLEISEFRKAEGSLSCLSIIFREVKTEHDEHGGIRK